LLLIFDNLAGQAGPGGSGLRGSGLYMVKIRIGLHALISNSLVVLICRLNQS